MDANESGFVTIAELTCLALTMFRVLQGLQFTGGMTEELVREYARGMFELLDVDKSGSVTYQDYTRTMAEHADVMAQLAAEVMGLSSGLSFNKVRQDVSALVDELVAALALGSNDDLPQSIRDEITNIRQMTGSAPYETNPTGAARQRSGSNFDDRSLCRQSRPHCKGSIAFGDPHWNIVLNIMLGLRISVGTHELNVWREVDSDEFSTVDSHTLPSSQAQPPLALSMLARLRLFYECRARHSYSL